MFHVESIYVSCRNTSNKQLRTYIIDI